MKNKLLLLAIVALSCNKSECVKPSVAGTSWAYSKDNAFKLSFTDDSLYMEYGNTIPVSKHYLQHGDTFYFAPSYAPELLAFRGDSLFYSQLDRTNNQTFYKTK